MQRLSVWLRWIAAGFFTLIVIPLLVEFLKHLAENIGLYDRPREAAGAVLNFFLSLAELPWLRVTALVLAGFVAGLWLDWLLRKFDGSRAKARENLGYEMMNLASRYRQRIGPCRPLPSSRLQPQAYLCFHQSQAGGVMDTRRSNAPQRRHALSQTRRYAPQRWAFCGGEAGSPRVQRGFRKESKAARLTGNNLLQQSR
jgi:hypothetical protein